MAASAPKTTEDEVKCSLCLEIYTNPKLLNCFHIYCQSCLQKLVTKEPPDKPSIACPVCRQVTPVPQSGVEGLHAAFHINRKLKAMRNSREKSEGKASDEDSTNLCPEHSGEPTKMYCETCGVLVCSKCVVLGGKHHRHDYDSLARAFEKYKLEIGSAIKPMEEKLASVRKALDDLDNSTSNVASQEVAVEATISDAISQIHAMLDSRQADLLDQLQQVTDSKLRDLEAQKGKLKSTHSQLTGAMDFIRESGEMSSSARLMMRTTTSLHPDDLKPVVEADVRFETLPGVAEAFQNFGDLSLAEESSGRGVDGRSAKAVKDHEACGADEISFTSGDIIDNIEKVNEKWWSGECKGRRGLFPHENVQLI